MRLLLDTHLLLRAAADTLPDVAAALVDDPANELLFSAASIWEIAIKTARRREDFIVDPDTVWRALVANGYVHLPVTAGHAASVAALPGVHKDPFDRLLLSQALAERVTLLTADAQLGLYGSPVQLVTR